MFSSGIFRLVLLGVLVSLCGAAEEELISFGMITESPGGLEEQQWGLKLEQVVVPDVVGMSVKEAREKLKEEGFEVELVGGDPAPDDDHSYKVAQQIPLANRLSFSGDPIKLVVYGKFVRVVTVPNVVSLNTPEAVKQLKDLGLSPSILGGNPAPKKELTYAVERQDPPAGTQLHSGDIVTIIVYGDYQAVYTVPDIVGKKRSEALSMLGKSGFRMSVKVGESAPSIEDIDKVYSQNPSSGTQFKEEDEVVSVLIYGDFIDEKGVNDVK